MRIQEREKGHEASLLNFSNAPGQHQAHETTYREFHTAIAPHSTSCLALTMRASTDAGPPTVMVSTDG